jgi:hypothetical protein
VSYYCSSFTELQIASITLENCRRANVKNFRDECVNLKNMKSKHRKDFDKKSEKIPHKLTDRQNA